MTEDTIFRVKDRPQSPSNLFGSTFVQRLTDDRIKTLSANVQKTGQPIFRPRDVVVAYHPLAKLIRMMFVERRVTENYLASVHKAYGMAQGWNSDEINQHSGNFRKIIFKPTPTFLNYEMCIAVLGGVVVDRTVTLLLDSGRTVHYRYNDTTLMSKSIPEDGTPIFRAKEIFHTKHPLARFIRMYIVDQDITMELFRAKHQAYYEAQLYPPNWISSNRNNSIRRYFKDSPMFMAWELFNSVMGISLLDMATTIRHNDGMVVTYALSDSEHYAAMPDPWPEPRTR